MRGVRKRFGATVALEGVDFAVAAGEVHALVGENGAGKSTLMKVLSGAVVPDEGSMQLDGEPYRPRNPHDARSAGVAMIYQELSLAPHLSVAENIMLGMEPSRFGVLGWKEIDQRARDALHQLGHTDLSPSMRVASLSVAAQQIVEIARALAVGCRVLVLDEPSSSLTREDVRRLFQLIARLRQQGVAIVYISHFIEEVKEVADRFTVLRDGKTVGGGETANASVEEIVAMMVGRKIDELYPRSQRHPGRAVLEIRALSGVRKPESATLTLYRGEVFGIAGLVGAGRTELLRTIFGLDPVRRGEIRIGVHAGPASTVQRWRQGVGMLSENRKEEGLSLPLSIADNITLSNLPWLVRPSRQIGSAGTWIEKLDVRCRGPQQQVGELSGGNQQKVAFARLLYHNVDVLLLDEPTRGIDVASKARIYQLIDELAVGGKAVLMVSSYLPELLGVCDRVAVMCRGRLGAPRDVREWNEHELMIEATGTA